MSIGLKQTLLLSLAAALFAIGVHRTLVEGLYQNYWLFMLSLGFLMWYGYNRRLLQEKEREARNYPAKPAQKAGSPKKKQR